jgi:hypothetical protein
MSRMQTLPSRRRWLLLGLTAIVAAAAALSLLQVAEAAGPKPRDVPSQIQDPIGPGNKVFLIGHAFGVQIYTCNGSVWSSAVPRADLFGNNGKLIIHHFAGPSWQANDGSTAVGTPIAAVTVDQTAIPWVLLSTTTTPGPDGDQLVDTTFIQRIHTVGGHTPPAADCNAATAGAVVEVPYTADYVFWKKTAA